MPSSLYSLSSAASSSFSLHSSSSSNAYELSSPRNSYDSSSANDILGSSLPASLNGVLPSSPNWVYEDNYVGSFTVPAAFSRNVEDTFSSGKASERIQNILEKEKIDDLVQELKKIDELGQALKSWIVKSDYLFHLEFDLMKHRLKELIPLPNVLLDVLQNMVNDKWIGHPKTRNKLEGIILLYKKKFPHTCSESVPEGMKGIYKAFKEKKDKLTRSSNPSDQAQLGKTYGQRKASLHRAISFFESFYKDSHSYSKGLWLLIANSLIANAVGFISTQYIFPSIQRRWQ